MHAGVNDVTMESWPETSQPQTSAMNSYTGEELSVMHMSPISDVEEETRNDSEPVNSGISNQVLLLLLLSPVFCALAYQEDVVRLAQASRVALEPCIDFHLAFIRHMVRVYITC